MNGERVNAEMANGINSTTVDVVIPVYQPDAGLEELLRRLLTQSHPVNRIFIMKTEPQTWSEEEIRPLFEGTSVELSVFSVDKEKFDHGGTRHLGILNSDAQVCICMTQDAMPQDSHLVERLLEALCEMDSGDSDTRIAAAYARQLPASGCGVIERLTREFNYPKESRVKSIDDLQRLGIKTYFCSNVCAAYDRELYMHLGGFLRQTIFNEDMIFAAKAVQLGYAIAYAAEAEVIHSHNYTGMMQLRRNFDLAVSQREHWELFKDISSEDEGVRLVMQTGRQLLCSGFWYLLPKLFYQSAMKYLGYRLGTNYLKLPEKLVRRLTMNKEYWDRDY